MRYALFADRHDLPEHSGALYTGFNFETFQPETNETIWRQALGDRDCEVIVTGLTMALTHFIDAWHTRRLQHLYNQVGSGYGTEAYWDGSITLLHYNRATNAYVPQRIF